MSKAKKGILLSVMSVILVAVIVANVLCMTVFDQALRVFVGELGGASEEDTSAASYVYNARSYTTSTLKEAKDALSEAIGVEGAVMLKHEGGTMPYSAGTKFSFFGNESVNWLGLENLKTVFTDAGFAVNEELWDFYATGAGSSYKRGVGSLDFGKGGMDYVINEVPLSVLQSANVLDSAKGTVPVFVITRICGEGVDPARGMYMPNKNTTLSGDDALRSYQELNSDELEILAYLNDNYDDILVLINSGNPIEAGWMEEYEHVHNVLVMASSGRKGMTGLVDLIKGEYSPSGHLTATYAYDVFSAPAAINSGDFEYMMNDASSGFYYLAYEEGIYVGYRYYETRYEDYVLGQGDAGDYDWASTVQFPFGYGLSYTEFQWSDYETAYDSATETFTVKVTVKNVGDVAGKEVVQVYAQSPYTDYDRTHGVEKSSVNLVGYAKTDILAAGASQTVEVSFSREQLKSYDTDGFGTYIMEDGDYYITAASDAHRAINNILAAKDLTEEQAARMSGEGHADFTAKFTGTSLGLTFDENQVNAQVYAADTATGTPIVNQFDFGTRADMTYLTRNNWVGTFPTPYGEKSARISEWGNRVMDGDTVGYVWTKELSAADYATLTTVGLEASQNPDSSTYAAAKFEQDNKLALIDLRGMAYDDEKWDLLLDEMSGADLSNLIARAGYGTVRLESIDKPKGDDKDAASGLVNSKAMGNINGGILLAQTFNVALSEEFGRICGEDCLLTGVTGWYAPAMNIVRSAFTARVNEYYGEDPFISGSMAAATAKAATATGINVFIKHFAVNEQDLHRGDGSEGTNTGGLVTWANEQSIRELYLVPFEMCIKQEGNEQFYFTFDEQGNEVKNVFTAPACNGVMTSFTRIGYTWAGGSYHLITNVLKNEWGFRGFVLTDYDNGGYMDTLQCIYAGGSGKLSTLNTCNYSLDTSNTMEVHYARESAHSLLYSFVNSSAMNGMIHDTRAANPFPVYGLILIGVDVICVGVIALLLVKIFGKGKKKKADA